MQEHITTAVACTTKSGAGVLEVNPPAPRPLDEDAYLYCVTKRLAEPAQVALTLARSKPTSRPRAPPRE